MMRIAYPKVFPLALLTVLGGLVWWLNETSTVHFSSHRLNAQTPDLTAFQVVGVRFNPNGKPFTHLTSSVLHHYRANNITWLTSPRLVYSAEDKPKLIITGTQAKFLQETNELFLYDKVKVIREAFADQPAITVDTSNVHVDINQETAQSSAAMLAIAGKHQIKAVGFYFNNKSEILSLHDQVKVHYVRE
jgi:LPS export ABC transporter protein LptC